VIDPSDRTRLAAAMTEIAIEAGAIAARFFRPDRQTGAAVSYKDGGSPVSEADLAADAYLRERLLQLLPDAGWLSEETEDTAARLDKQTLFIVDPIDGTRAFIKGDRRWGVSLAIVEAGRPVAGVLHMPALEETYVATLGGGAARNGRKLAASPRTNLDGATIGGPRKTLEALVKSGLALDLREREPSLAYRLALVGAGDIDAALASANACDWDIAAADLIIREAGGLLSKLDGTPPLYNAPQPRHGVLAASGARLHELLIAALRRLPAT